MGGRHGYKTLMADGNKTARNYAILASGFHFPPVLWGIVFQAQWQTIADKPMRALARSLAPSRYANANIRVCSSQRKTPYEESSVV